MVGWVLLAIWAADESAVTTTPTAEDLRFFETRVRPVLLERCETCHGAKKQWGGLRVDQRAALLKGGESGPAIVPGQPRESLLIRAIRHESTDLRMPEDGKLSDEQIRDIEHWVERGAPFPATVAHQTRLRDPNHWAFQPLRSAAMPTVRHRDWPRTWIDPYVRSAQEQQELAPANAADRRALLRRLAFDLTGLPPTLEQYETFLEDNSIDATARLVDRLLASPAYGERWGRHWLDVARYADSNGLDENIAHGNAWRYRDYVVQSFNADKPFDQLVREQLAGDLLPASHDAQRNEQLIATGFLVVGPKVLAEVDEAKMRMDIVDEQLDTTGRAFLGLTLGCARCHDHKFDPITTVEYYGLAGIFKSTRSMETYTKVARWRENPLATPEVDGIKASFAARVAEQKRRIDMLVAEASEAARKTLPADRKPPENLETLFPDETRQQLKQLRDTLSTLEKEGPDLPSAMGVGEDTIVDLAVHIRGNPLKLGDVVPRRVPSVLASEHALRFTNDNSGRLTLAEWLVGAAQPLTARVFVNRVWRWHLGKGLVRSTDNFGLLGDVPSHPDLLDALASRFVADGWSVKRLNREIVLSSTYGQSSQTTPANLESDPDNQFYSRAETRRLEAEAIRDALLSVSDQLDATHGGSMLKVKNRGYLFDHTSIDKTEYTSNRRSLYLPVIRNNVYDVFQLLDFPDPAVSTGDRATTTVAPQALLMMNSDLVLDCASRLAARLRGDTDDDTQRIRRLHVLAYAREPSSVEVDDALRFLEQSEMALAADQADAGLRREEAWMTLCHVILAANEFLYVR